jgi:hypothetical protein
MYFYKLKLTCSKIFRKKICLIFNEFIPYFCRSLYLKVQWPAKKTSHHLNVSVKKALITHLDFEVIQK